SLYGELNSAESKNHVSYRNAYIHASHVAAITDGLENASFTCLLILGSWTLTSRYMATRDNEQYTTGAEQDICAAAKVADTILKIVTYFCAYPFPLHNVG
uniref:Uncharacterized protein n=1 Tax=Parascaris univalens TaxID=6257 RepID=A0A915CI87_PARUN